MTQRSLKTEQAMQENVLRALSKWKEYPQRLDRLERHPGTCEWITRKERFIQWKANPGFDMLFITGASGCGKSVLAKYIASYLQETPPTGGPSSTVLSFFCKTVTRSPAYAPIVECFTYQLLEKFPILFRHVFPKFNHRDLTELFSKSFETAVELFQSIVRDPECGHLALIIDGIDECDTSFVGKLLSGLDTLLHGHFGRPNIPSHSFKVLITCQPSDAVSISLAAYPPIVIDEEDVENDIISYIEDEVDAIARARQYDRVSSTLKEEVIAMLRESANGMFLWVYYVLQSLRQMKQVTGWTVKETVRSFPPDIDNYYLRTIEQASNQEISSQTTTAAILELLIFTYRPLTSAELAEALVIDDKFSSWAEIEDLITCDIDTLVRSRCAPFVKVDHGKVSIAHHSVREFILRLPSRKDLSVHATPFCFDQSRSHLLLALKCLNYLMLEDIPSEMSSIEIAKSQFKFLDYAINSWPYHLKEAGIEVKRCYQLLGRFFANPGLGFRHVLTRQERFSPEFYLTLAVGVFDLDNLLHIASISPQVLTTGHFLKNFHHLVPWLLQRISFGLFPRRQLVIDLNTSGLLHVAARMDSQAIVNFLINSGRDVDEVDTDGDTPLHMAALEGNTAIAEQLLAAGANPNIFNHRGNTALQYACAESNSECAELLVEKGASVGRNNLSSLESPLWLSLLQGSERLALTLASKGADLSDLGPSGETPFHAAAVRDWRDFTRLCLSIQGPSQVNQRDSNLFTPVHYAANVGAIDSARLLADAGALVEPPLSPTGDSIPTPLTLAVSNDHTAIAEWLMRKQADIKAKLDGATLLHLAVKNNNLALATSLLSTEIDIDALDSDGYTALWLACTRGYEGIVDALLAKSPNINLVSSSSMINPLHMASWAGFDGIVKLLCEKGANVDARTTLGTSPTIAAVISNHPGVLTILLDFGARIDLKDNDDETALLKAARQDKEELVNILLSHRAASTDNASDSGLTPLHAAISNGNWNIVDALLKSGSDIEEKDPYGYSPLLSACTYGYIGLFNKLLDAGADLHTRTDLNIKLLHAASLSASSAVVERVLRLLEDEGSLDINEIADGRTALHFACFRANSAVVRMLINKGADCNALTENSRETPLHIAVGRGNLTITRILLNHGAALEAEDEDGSTALSLACLGGYFDLVKEFLSLKANNSKADKRGRTALHCAALGGFTDVIRVTDVIRLLHSYGADLDVSDQQKLTALQHATIRFNRPVIQLLVALGAKIDDSKNLLHLSIYEFTIWHSFPERILDGLSIYRSETQRKTWVNLVQALVEDLLKSLSPADIEFPFPNEFQYRLLGHCLLLLGKEFLALTAFQVAVNRNNQGVKSSPPWFMGIRKLTHNATCDNCLPRQRIRGDRFPCRICFDLDLCESCMESYKLGKSKKTVCTGHSFIRISGSPSDYESFDGKEKCYEHVRRWLCAVQEHFSEDKSTCPDHSGSRAESMEGSNNDGATMPEPTAALEEDVVQGSWSPTNRQWWLLRILNLPILGPPNLLGLCMLRLKPLSDSLWNSIPLPVEGKKTCRDCFLDRLARGCTLS